MTLSNAESLCRLRLIRSEGIGPITFYKLLARFGTAEKALVELPTLAQRGGRKTSPKIFSEEQAHEEISALKQIGGRFIMIGDDDYPAWLSTNEDSPPVLSILGDASFLSKPVIGIVGARNASSNAKRFTHKISGELGEKGQVIASGMARGIDTAAHTASLKTGTIAVLAGGVDQIYPTENTDLYHEIIKYGCVLSEMPFGTAPTAHHFPRRNRIVSALSKGVVVVEASMKSGSLITARLAAEQGREVFAVPGFPGDPRAAGPNSLIKNGATLIEKADDILAEIAAMDDKAIKPVQPALEGIAEAYTPFEYEGTTDEIPANAQETILDNLSSTPLNVDTLSRDSGLNIKITQMVLLELELGGQITRHPGNRVSKVA